MWLFVKTLSVFQHETRNFFDDFFAYARFDSGQYHAFQKVSKITVDLIYVTFCSIRRLQFQFLYWIFTAQCSTKVSDQLLHTYVVTLFLSPQKVRSNTNSTLILFFLNHQKSEVSKMVCFAIVACLDPALRRRIVAAISRNSGFLV